VLGGDGKPATPTPVESARFDVARRLFLDLGGSQRAGSRPLRVVRGGVVGLHLDWQGRNVHVHAARLASDFDDAIIPCLAALARVGGKSASSDGDRLTSLLEAVLDDPSRLRACRARWDGTETGTAQLAPIDATDDDAPPEWDDPRLRVEVFGPPGLPAVDALLERVRRLARETGVRAAFQTVVVQGPNAARFHAVCGVPALGVGALDVVGTKVRRRGWYAAPPIPDDAIVAALVQMSAALARSRRG